MALIGVLVLGCAQDFASPPDLTVTIAAAPAWPTQLGVTDAETLSVTVTDASGRPITGLALDWSSSNDAVLALARVPPTSGRGADSLAAQLHVVVTAMASGTTTIQAAVTRPGFAPVQLQRSITVAPLSVLPSGTTWPDTLTVTEVDTLAAVVHRAFGGALVTNSDIVWRAGDPSILSVAAMLPPQPTTRVDSLLARQQAVVTARLPGTTEIVVDGGPPGFEAGELHVPVRVQPLRLALADSALRSTLSVTDTVRGGVRVLGARGQPLPGRAVTWSTSDPSILQVTTVTQAGADSGKAQVTALRSGTADVIATVAPVGFAATALRTSVTSQGMSVGPVAVLPLPASLTVTDTQRIAVRVLGGNRLLRRAVTWTSSDPSILQVAAAGGTDTALAVVTALRSGNAQVVATVAPSGFEAAELRDTVGVTSIVVQPVGTWPAQLAVSDSPLVETSLSRTAGVSVTWRSSDPSVLAVQGGVALPGDQTSFDAQRRARLVARRSGTATMIATVDRLGFESVALSSTVQVQPVSLRVASGRGLPSAGISVTDADTVRLEVVAPGGTVQAGKHAVTWSSTNPAVLQVTDLGGSDSLVAQVVGARSGQASIIASVGAAGFEPAVETLAVAVGALRIDTLASRPFPDSLTVTDTQTVFVVVRGNDGQPRQGRALAWTSSDPSILQVAPIRLARDTAVALVTALGLGSAEVIATIAPSGFEPAERRRTTRGVPIAPRLEGTPWPDTLTVTDSAIVDVTIPRSIGTSITFTSSDPSVLGVSPDPTGLGPATALLVARGRGAANVIATVVRPGFATAQVQRAVHVDSVRITIDTTVIRRALTVTEVDTVTAMVPNGRSNRPAITWSASDASILRVSPLATTRPDSSSAVVTALRSGQARVTATVAPAGFGTSALSVGFTTAPILTSHPGGHAHQLHLVVGDSVSDTVLATNGNGGALGLPLTWSSSNSSVLQLAGTGGDSARLLALRQGVSLVTAFVDPGGSEPGQLLDTVRVDALQLLAETSNPSGRWPDTVSVSDADTIAMLIPNSSRLVPLRWQSSDPTILKVVPVSYANATTLPDSIRRSLRAVVTALARGSATITVVAGVSGQTDTVALGRDIAVRERWIAVSAGGSSTCGITYAHAAYCWGFRPGNGTAGFVLGPQRVIAAGGAPQFTQISVGEEHSCGVAVGGLLYCWGMNEAYQLGNGTQISTYIAVPTQASELVSSVTTSELNTCAVSTSGPVICWGVWNAGQLGTGTILAPNCDVGRLALLTASCQQVPPDPFAAAVNAPEPLVSVSLGAQHACGVGMSGLAYCWGRADLGRTGNTGSYNCTLDTPGTDAAFPCHLFPYAVAGGLHFTEVHASKGFYGQLSNRQWSTETRGHTCGLTSGSSVYCWGLNDFGAAGPDIGTTCQDDVFNPGGTYVTLACVTQPSLVGTGFIAVDAGGTHSCGLKLDGSAWCWGDVTDGRLGNLGGDVCQTIDESGSITPSDTACSRTPVPVMGGLHFNAISAGLAHTCAITLPEGVLYCWGNGVFGTLGNGQRSSSMTPVRVLEPSN